ncbi:hypothetical protein HH214_02315 [Mucilaginibacter robiniae]|uniref:Outer membrane protein beta-barrel domain-containing protein n=1 Tax=Mucilaginibacter robiniae TaxID=2728022 RepID=A0A7L5DUQ7_9SPHI|nr:DUF6588 family protein [Mucilaginibacter robiniae]QJD94792.1 hypothetical protein HH214_02315 [Mucilaginibacter robiniae]
MKKPLLSVMAILSFITLRATAQTSDGVSQLLRTAPGDATKLFSAYANPLFKSLGTGLNNGWTNTAKTKGLLHFELRVSVSDVFTPASDKTFDINQLGLSSSVKVASGSSSIAPTFTGSKNVTPPTLDLYSNNGIRVDRFTLPARQISSIPTPQLQLTAGLPGNTDVTIRAIPKTKISDDIGSIGMFGFGLKHDIMSDIIGNTAAQIVPFNLAVLAGYTHFSYEDPLSVQPSTGKAPDASSTGKTDFSTQRIQGHLNGFNAQVIISKKLMFFTPFAAVGYSTAKTNVGLLGNYPVTSGLTTYTVYTDPIRIKQNSINTVKLDAGFQLDLSVFKFYASGSLGEYKSVNAGIGLGF